MEAIADTLWLNFQFYFPSAFILPQVPIHSQGSLMGGMRDNLGQRTIK
jgi:hypothetical protein